MFLTLACLFVAATPPPDNLVWQKLPRAPYNGGKQDDIFFVTPEAGWSVNGSGRIYHTTNGGNTWTLQLQQEGTYFRCITFLDKLHGFAGNIGTDYYPGVTDSIPLYETIDSGHTWSPVRSLIGRGVTGLCALEAVNNHTIVGAGRVGGPTVFIKSTNAGKTWTVRPMMKECAMILDIKFFSAEKGLLFAASANPADESHAIVLMTTDGGTTWKQTFSSSRLNDICWKASFPSRDVGYLTILHANAPKDSIFFAKTTDGGLHWKEHLLKTSGAEEFGIGFLDERAGWIGTSEGGLATNDGGESWSPVTLGRYANKIRIVRDNTRIVGYAIGLNVYKLAPAGSVATSPPTGDTVRTKRLPIKP